MFLILHQVDSPQHTVTPLKVSYTFLKDRSNSLPFIYERELCFSPGNSLSSVFSHHENQKVNIKIDILVKTHSLISMCSSIFVSTMYKRHSFNPANYKGFKSPVPAPGDRDQYIDILLSQMSLKR